MRSALWAIVVCCGLMSEAHAQVRLAAAPFATYVDDEGEPSRLTAIIKTAFDRMEIPVSLEVMRPAFLGSGLSAGRLDGEFDFIDLNDRKPQFIYSAGFLPFYLYATSRTAQVNEVRLLPHLKDSRVAIENQFANTPQVRLIKDIKWSRNPSTFDAFRQLADGRAPYLMTTRLLIDEFNRLLWREKEKQLYASAVPLISGHFYLSLRAELDDASDILDAFNQAIDNMQNDGTYNQLLGLSWLSKDTDGDGVAELISSGRVIHAALEQEQTLLAYPLDDAPVQPGSTFIIDGQPIHDWDAAITALGQVEIGQRASLLDADVYNTMIRRW